MPKVQMLRDGDVIQYALGTRPLRNGDVVEVRLGGNRGWEPVTIEGLPGAVRVRTTADDGTSFVTTLPREAEVRWPG